MTSLQQANIEFIETEKPVNMPSKRATKKPVKKPVKKVAKKPNVKDRISQVVSKVRGRFNNKVKKVTPRRKKTQKQIKLEKELAKQYRKRVILGIGLLLVVVSIYYSTSVTRTFVDSFISLLLLTPQVIWAVITLIKAFSKLYK